MKAVQEGERSTVFWQKVLLNLHSFCRDKSLKLLIAKSKVHLVLVFPLLWWLGQRGAMIQILLTSAACHHPSGPFPTPRK